MINLINKTNFQAIGDQYCQYGPSTFFKGLRITKSESAKNKSSTKLVDNDVAEDEKKHENERFVREVWLSLV